MINHNIYMSLFDGIIVAMKKYDIVVIKLGGLRSENIVKLLIGWKCFAFIY